MATASTSLKINAPTVTAVADGDLTSIYRSVYRSGKYIVVEYYLCQMRGWRAAARLTERQKRLAKLLVSAHDG